MIKLGRMPFMSVLLLYWAFSLHNLTVVPAVYEDEPWQASTGWQLAQHGVFGSDLFAGFYHMESRYYGYMPVHPLLLAGVFRVAGPGLFQARYETVALGLMVLALTYTLAVRLFRDPRIGLVALVFLLAVRLTAQTPYHLSGILFLDMARISRYDMAVPVFGLAALLAYHRGWRSRCRRFWYPAAGFLAGLAGLSHLYGLFWLPVLLLLCARQGPAGRRRALASIAAGFLVAWLPYLVYVLQDLPDWQGQTRIYADRFDLLHLSWYLDNLRLEPQRYAAGLGRGPWWARPGLWGTLILLPLSLGSQAWHAWRRRDPAAQMLVLPALLLPLLFALLIRLKLSNYLLAFWPLWAIAIGWGAVRLWDRTPGPLKGAESLLRPLLLVCGAAVVLEGTWQALALQAAAASTTPYAVYSAQVRQFVPPGARVLGLHNYWFDLDDTAYRSFALPVMWADPRLSPQPLSFAAGLDRLAPDIILVDRQMRAYFADPAYSGRAHGATLAAWLAQHHGIVVGRIDDETYGLMEIFRVPP